MASKEYTKEYLEKNIKPLLVVGAQIKIGKRYAKEIGGFKPGEVITLIEGTFEYDNGLYVQTQYTPAIWDEQSKDFDSIYHLFGNHLENWYDCEVIKTSPTDRIAEEAEAYVAKTRGQQGRVETYIAGATATHDRAKVLVKKLKQIDYHLLLTINRASSGHEIDYKGLVNYLHDQASKALEQWEGKEVGDEM